MISISKVEHFFVFIQTEFIQYKRYTLLRWNDSFNSCREKCTGLSADSGHGWRIQWMFYLFVKETRASQIQRSNQPCWCLYEGSNFKSKWQFSLLNSYQYIRIALHVFCVTCHIYRYWNKLECQRRSALCVLPTAPLRDKASNAHYQWRTLWILHHAAPGVPVAWPV